MNLREALSKAKKENITVRRERVQVQSNGRARDVNLEVSPLPGQGREERLYLIVFQDAASVTAKGRREQEQALRTKHNIPAETARLKRELAQIREQFQALIEEHETTSEEFKSANEESSRRTKSCKALTKNSKPPRKSSSPATKN